ncbi:hypothetical protein F4821DRAFT_220702 [Hypoxylon rubiginosum]|uniref:Uncharacterized protein n=1 Tax=Hypoxylon rubiginosum TaxID=110542 RepID=A0ACC0DM78_9PEZI|nr:hypothetical protein F4821DRAFT_220702 [Hypoxylon rubiginosum]
MQDRNQDAFFDSNKYHFPSGALATPRQPGLEVAPVRDEQGTPGLQPVPNEQKYADIGSAGLYDATPPYRTIGAAHADELTSQGMQAVHNVEPQQLARSQDRLPSQEQLSYPWTGPSANQYYGQSFQTLPSPQASGYSGDNPTYSPVLIASNAESHHLNPQATTTPSSSWPKERETPVKKDIKVQRWVLWTVGGIILILVIIGAVLGGILGTRRSNSYDDNGAIPSNSTSNETTPDSTSSTPVQSIKVGSKLAVTGYRTKTDYSIRLFYQDQNNQLRFMDKENVGANWTEPTLLDTLPYEPMAGGAIAAGAYMYGNPAPKIEFFYEDKYGVVRGQNFNFDFENGTIPLKGEAGSINSYPLQMAEDTRISCYFPYIVSQDDSNQVRWTTMLGQNSSNLSAPWWVNDTDWSVEASKGGGMVVLPVAQKYLHAGGIVYRAAEGTLSIKIRDESVASNEGVAWRKGALSKEIPAGASIGAFSVGRPYDNNNQVNTYILYQEDDGTIQVVWQDDDTGWKGPQTYDALDGAKKGTDIVCLTPGAYDSASVEVSREQDMNRCFFLTTNTTVKEVWYNGTSWNDVGVVPTT